MLGRGKLDNTFLTCDQGNCNQIAAWSRNSILLTVVRDTCTTAVPRVKSPSLGNEAFMEFANEIVNCGEAEKRYMHKYYPLGVSKDVNQSISIGRAIIRNAFCLTVLRSRACESLRNLHVFQAFLWC